MKKVLSLFKVLFIPLCIASLVGLGGAVVVDDAVAGARSAKQSASKNGSKKKKPKTRCNKRGGERAYFIRGRCRPLRSLQEIAPTPGDPEVYGTCRKDWRPVYIITTEGCYTFGSDCEADNALKRDLKDKEILSRRPGECEWFLIPSQKN